MGPMPSITIRQLEPELKRQLRLRAARHGRSMEDEARTILREATAEQPEVGQAGGNIPPPERPPPGSLRTSPFQREVSPRRPHVLLIIGGGIAAYKSLDLIRRLRERGLALRCILTKAAQQ